MIFRFTRKSLLILLIPLLLVLGQQAGLRHELSHFKQHSEQPDQPLPGQHFCEECAALGQMADGAVSTPYIFAAVSTTHRISTEINIATVAADLLASRNRGPPVSF